jgi:co-chaperonin GroES (HSP10)
MDTKKKVKTNNVDKLLKHKALVNLDEYTDINTIGHQIICEVVMSDEKPETNIILLDDSKKEMDLSKIYNDHPERAIVKHVGEDVYKNIKVNSLIYYLSPYPKMLLIKDKIMLVIQDYDILAYRDIK